MMRCEICRGPIGTGEPVVTYANGLAHRFRTTCDWFKQKIAEYDAKFLAEAKVVQ
jgi:hypothetical protein